MIIIAIVAVLIISAFTYLVDRVMLTEFKDEYRSIKEEQI